MRLGDNLCQLTKPSKAYQVYGKAKIHERHRHRYEFNNSFLKEYEEAGMLATGINPEGNLVEIVELRDHPWFIGVQFHPEYRSTVENPHPLFVRFVKAALENR
jgi:CTP synthase